MPYRQWVIDGKKSEIRRVTWRDVAQAISNETIVADAQKALRGADGKWTNYVVNTRAGKLYLSGSRESLEEELGQ
jgi:L-ascorbate metabolism protein UlaG (beta-lactamase superfamily)